MTRHLQCGIGLMLALAGVAPAWAADAPATVGERPQPFDDRYAPAIPGFKVSIWIAHLDTPWSLVFLPDGRALVSQRSGAIRMIENNRLLPDPVITRSVVQDGEGGLMGLAVHPRFPELPFVYAMETVDEGGRRQNRVVRLSFERNRLAYAGTVVGGI